MKIRKSTITMRNGGFTLIDLMIAVAVLAVIASIAVPAYTGYIRIARVETMEHNMRSLRVLLEDRRLETGSYGATASGVATISEAYDWDPDSDLSFYTMTVSVTSTDNYDIWMVDTRSNTWRRCDNRMSSCCDGDDGTPAACP